MKSLSKYIYETLNAKSISKEELDVLYDEFKKKYNVDLSKKNLKFFNLYKDFNAKGGFRHLWISFMNDPKNRTKHIEPYFFGVLSSGAMNKFNSIKFVEFSANNKISINDKKLFNKYTDDIIKELNIRVLSKDMISKFINSLNESLNEGALTNRRNIHNAAEVIRKKMYDLLEMLYDNEIHFNIEEIILEKATNREIYDKVYDFYRRHHKELQYVYDQKLPPELTDIDHEESYNEITTYILSIMINADLIPGDKMFYKVLLDSTKIKNIKQIHNFIDVIEQNTDPEKHMLVIYDFDELNDMCKTDNKVKKLFYLNNNTCSISFKMLLENIDEVIDIIS